MIREYVKTIFEGLYEDAKAMQGLKHPGTKGTFNELLLDRFISRFLPSPLKATSGHIVDCYKFQSNQTDIIIYDDRVLPPLIAEKGSALCPLESVVATIEVKSSFRRKDVEDTNAKAVHLQEEARYCLDIQGMRIRREFFAFHPHRLTTRSTLMKQKSGKTFLHNNANRLSAICVMDNVCWENFHDGGGWLPHVSDEPSDFSETGRFLSIMIDNARYAAVHNWRLIKKEHKDLTGAYIRYAEDEPPAR